MIDCGFPVIKYKRDADNFSNGLMHGEEFRQAITELVEIRRELMLAKNPALKKHLEPLAHEQIKTTENFAPHLWQEISGIAKGAGLTHTDLVILNNYTDFRDISLPEEGCSTVFIKNAEASLAGQTWDMHRSAKNFLCLIELEDTLILSLTGCVGMMGYNSQGLMIGVNNINTDHARAALIWPVLVRRALEEKYYKDMEEIVMTAPVTSGHNYLLGSEKEGGHYEVSPLYQEKVLHVKPSNSGRIFHTNHCLGEEHKKIEQTLAVNSTTHKRYDLIEDKIAKVKDAQDFTQLLKDHDNYPMSICSHYESGAQDPSFTCGGGLGDFRSKVFHFWRGCKKHDKNYVEHNYKLDWGRFKKI
jgi:isopenicillin-N N-acyltransferase like protein